MVESVRMAFRRMIAIWDFGIRFPLQELIRKIESTFDRRQMLGQLALVQILLSSQM
jgi:hypothetical protein